MAVPLGVKLAERYTGEAVVRDFTNRLRNYLRKAERFEGQRKQDGFQLVEAREHGQLVGIGFGVTLLPNTPWWQNLTAPVSENITREYSNRTFAVVELLVRGPWRRRHIAEEIHHSPGRLSQVGLAAGSAERNPLPGSPVFDVMVKQLGS